MQTRFTQRLAAVLLLSFPILVNIPFALLAKNFGYPDVLRLPAGEILTRFLAGGPGLVFTWYGFAVSCLPFFAGVVLLPSSFPEQRTLMRLSTVLGTIAGIVQVVGLLRWVFVVPYLARLYATTATADGRLAIEVAFSTLHQFAGVSLGEHTGQLFTAAWMVTLSFVLWQTHRRKLAVLGASTAVAWLIGLAEGFGTVLDGVPTQLGAVAPLAFMSMSVWLVGLGIVLWRAPDAPVTQVPRVAR